MICERITRISLATFFPGLHQRFDLPELSINQKGVIEK